MRNEMKKTIINYLLSNSVGCWDGNLKATMHEKLVDIYIKYLGGDKDKLRENTRKLTDNLDTEIDFPLESLPNYGRLWGKFYTRFVELCDEVNDEILEDNLEFNPLVLVCKYKLDRALPILESYGYTFIGGNATCPERFLEVSKDGRTFKVTPNKYFGCKVVETTTGVR